MLKYLSDLFSSLLNMSVFMNDDSYKSNTSVEVEEKETEVEEKETGEIFEFIEINDDDVFDFFITKF